MSRTSRTLTTVVLVATLVGVWLAFAPRQLGGATSYVTTSGVSMLPTIHRGDLALVRPADRYRVGDVVAFHSAALNTVVLHRIAAVHDDATFITRGDNNTFDDPGRTPGSAIIGKLWIRLSHGGAALALARKPSFWLALVTVELLVGLMARRFLRSRRRRRQPQPTQKPPTAPGPVAILPPGIARWSAASAAAAVLVGGFAFSRPATMPVTRTAGYSQDLTFDYEAAVAPNAVYPDGHVRWGDPVYTALVKQLAVQVRYVLHGGATAPIHGTIALDVDLRSTDGWHRAVPAAPTTAFTGSSANATVVLNLDDLRSITAAVEQASGSPLGAVTATVTARVESATVIADHAVRPTANAPLAFGLGAGQLTRPDTKTRTKTDTTQINIRGTKANVLAFGPLRLAVGRGRALAIALGLTALAAATAAMISRRRLAALNSLSANVNHRYRNRIVSVQDLGQGTAVDVTSAKDFFRLADTTHDAVLHRSDQNGDIYQLEHGASHYRYAVHAPTAKDPTDPIE